VRLPIDGCSLPVGRRPRPISPAGPVPRKLRGASPAYGAALLYATTMLPGCATTASVATEHAAFCATAEPITWSRSDTRETVRQIREHNAVGITLCGWRGREPAKGYAPG
jgi:hypothetical protein